MSDSEDDFMSDKFLVEAPTTSRTYSQKRSVDQLKGQRRGQAQNRPNLKQLEQERRYEGLNRSLFDTIGTTGTSGNGESSQAGASGSASGSSKGGHGLSEGGNKALSMMQKMGWKVGEGLGRKRSPPSASSAPAEELNDDDRPRGGIGSSRLPNLDKPASSGTAAQSLPSTARSRPAPTEPIRISLWAGRKGLSARSPSPPPLPYTSGRNVDYLDPSKMARLGKETDRFREFQRKQFGEKEGERKAWKARELLIKYDEERGVKFHPLHVLPFDPLSTLPPPLLRLIYPAQALALSPSPPLLPTTRSPSPPPLGLPPGREIKMSAAERTREQMRRDMLSDVAREEEDTVLSRKRKLGLVDDGIGQSRSEEGDDGEGKDYDGVQWEDHVSGTKKVLRMDTETYLTFLLSQLRNEHHFCFWCGYKYKSFEEMDGPGGCPGDDEDDH